MPHSPHFRPALVVGLALALHSPAVAETWREQSSVTLDGRTIATIEVRNARGRIHVGPSRDGAVHIRALKIANSRTAEEARSLAEKTVVKFERGPDLRIEVVYPRIVHQVNIWRDSDDDGLPSTEVRFTIEIPARIPAALTVSSGDIETEDLAGVQSLRSSSGGIRVLDASGVVRARTASGDVDVSRARGGGAATASGSVRWGEATGPLEISTASGDIEVADARDSLSARARSGSIRIGRAAGGIVASAGSGSISVREAAGGVQLQTLSGSIDARLLRGTRAASLRASSGDVTVSLDPAAPWTVRARTAGGSIEIDESAVVERRSRRDVEARIRGGGAPVEITTASGSVRVEGGRP